MRKDSGTSNPSYDGAATFAVTGVTVPGDGVEKVSCCGRGFRVCPSTVTEAAL
jgi:hypothetical protein